MPVCLYKRLIECIINISRHVFTRLTGRKNVQCLYTEREIKSMFSKSYTFLYKPVWAHWGCYRFTVCLLWVTKPASYNGPFSIKSIICQKKEKKKKRYFRYFLGQGFLPFLLVLVLSLHYLFFYHVILFCMARVELGIRKRKIYTYLWFRFTILHYNVSFTHMPNTILTLYYT